MRGGARETDQDRRADSAAVPHGPDRRRGLDAFWRAAVRLRRQPNRPGVAEAAAATLCELARCGASSPLAAALRVDPESSVATWTVACYEVGDTAPSALHEYDDPVTAVGALVGCGTPSHLASELVCNGEEGLQWVAMTRTRSRVRFQLPDPLNTTARSTSLADTVRRRWREELELHRDLQRHPGGPDPARIRAPRASDAVSMPPEPTDGHPRHLAPASTPGFAPAAPSADVDPWTDEVRDDDGFSKAALAALGWRPDERASAPPPTQTSSAPRSADEITARHLNSAVRTALASAVPYMERYFLDALADRAAALASPSDDDAGASDLATVTEGLAELLRGQQELASELRNMQRRHLSEVVTLHEQIRRLEARIDAQPAEPREQAWRSPLGLPRPADDPGSASP